MACFGSLFVVTIGLLAGILFAPFLCSLALVPCCLLGLLIKQDYQVCCQCGNRLA
jgi:hypothetical protein